MQRTCQSLERAEVVGDQQKIERLCEGHAIERTERRRLENGTSYDEYYTPELPRRGYWRWKKARYLATSHCAMNVVRR